MSASDQVAVDFSFESDWLGRRKFCGPITMTWRSKATPKKHSDYFRPSVKNSFNKINISLETIWKGSETPKVRFFSSHSSGVSYLLSLVTKSFGETYRCHVVHMRGSHHGGAHVDSLFRQYCIQWLLFSTTLHRLLDVLPLSQFNHVRCLHASWYRGQTARCDQTTARETRQDS